MEIRALLTQVHPAPRGEARLRFAAALAATMKADLIGVGVQAFSPYIASTGAFGYVDAGTVQAIRDEIEAELEDAGKLFHATVEAFGIRGEWCAAVDDPVEVVSRLSRSADIIVASRRDPADGPAATADPGELLVSSGRPVLVLPPDAVDLKLETVLVAWKDGREARRSVADALPFLKAAKRVIVAEVCDADDEADASIRTAAVAHHLARHGVTAETRALKIGHGRVSAQLVDLANGLGADLIVAGAYAHPRIREWVFGGVTQDLLNSSPIACLMSH
jgi:nucleotide-binding universal stress UspA family protein